MTVDWTTAARARVRAPATLSHRSRFRLPDHHRAPSEAGRTRIRGRSAADRSAGIPEHGDRGRFRLLPSRDAARPPARMGTGGRCSPGKRIVEAGCYSPGGSNSSTLSNPNVSLTVDGSAGVMMRE